MFVTSTQVHLWSAADRSEALQVLRSIAPMVEGVVAVIQWEDGFYAIRGVREAEVLRNAGVAHTVIRRSDQLLPAEPMACLSLTHITADDVEQLNKDAETNTYEPGFIVYRTNDGYTTSYLIGMPEVDVWNSQIAVTEQFYSVFFIAIMTRALEEGLSYIRLHPHFAITPELEVFNHAD